MVFRYDITSRKDTEYFLNETQKIAKIGGWELDTRTFATKWSDETYRIHEIEPGTPTNTQDGIRFYAEHERPKISKMIQDCIEKAIPFESNFEFLSALGRKKWVHSKGVPEVDSNGKVIRITGIFQDITEAKEREKELGLILANNQIGIWRFDPLKNELFWDKSMFRLYDVEPNSFSGALDAWQTTLHPDFAKQAPLEFQSALAGTGNFESTFKVVTGKGETKDIGARALIERDSQGNPIFVTGVNWDRTREQRAVDEANKQIKISQHHAKLASIGQLAAGVGHEINNPLSIVMGYLSSLEKKIQKNNENAEDLEKYVSKIKIASGRILKIVEGLRTFSRSDSTEVHEFSPAEAVEESFNMLEEIYKKDGIDISLNKKCSLDMRILANRGRFQQVLMNLIANARDATEGKTNRKIEIGIFEETDSVRLYVKDNGCGIDRSIQERIYDPFFTTKKVNEGTGIGLSLVHSFVKEMEGTLSFTSEIDQGTTFSLTIPGKVVDQKKSLPSEARQMMDQFKESVMVVEDEEGVREVLSEMLEDLGFKVTSVENGRKAYDLYMQNPDKFKVILSDMKMPEMDGSTLLKKIRSHAGLRQPKFIIMTGGVDITFMDSANPLSGLIDGYFFKPFEKEKIKKVLSDCLSKSS